MSEHDTHWSAKAAWMRGTGATDAAWSTEGDLVHLKLGPAPTPKDPNEDREDPAKLSPLEQQRLARVKQREVTARSSGGPVRRLDGIG